MPKAWRVLQSLSGRSSLRTAVLAILYAALSALPLLAQGRPIEFADLMKMRRLGDLDVSSNGRWILFDVTDADLGNNRLIPHLWLIAVAGGRERPLTASLAGESQGRFSPDGTKILFVSARSGAPQIYVAPFDQVNGTPGAAQALTHMPTGAEGPIWSPDGESILFTSAVFPSCAGDAPSMEACNAQRQTEEEQDPDQPRIFTHLLFRHWDRFTGEKRSHLFLIPAAGGSERDLTPGVEQDIPPFSLDEPPGYAFSPDSKQIAFEWIPGAEQALDTGRQIFTLNLTDPKPQPVRISASVGGNFTPRYSPDGRYIAFRSQARAGYESDRFRLMVYERQSGRARAILPNFDRWVDDVVWAPDSRSIYFLSGVAGEEPVYQTSIGEAGAPGDEAAAGDGQKLRRLTLSGSYSEVHPVLQGDAVIATRSTVQRPPEIYLLHLHRTNADQPDTDGMPEKSLPRGLRRPPPTGATLTPQPESQLTHLNDALVAKLDLPAQQAFWFEGARRTAVQGFLLRPPGFNAQQKYPVKFLIHGGPEGDWGDAWSYRWNPELFAASGYVVIMINPRGSTGYGQTFVDGVNGDWGGKPYVDLMRGLDYAEAKYPFIDHSRECALGASYGGYMADWLLGHTDRFSCIVTHDGMFDAESFYGTTDELWFPEWEFGGTPWGKSAGGSGKDGGNLYRRWSPMLSAAKFKTPTLVIHGQLDYRLDVSQGLALFTTLQRLHVPSEMLYFPAEGHWVLKPRDSEIWNKTVSSWCDRYTKKSESATTTGAH